jgi:predicted XRE-type DNA-binding protein
MPATRIKRQVAEILTIIIKEKNIYKKDLPLLIGTTQEKCCELLSQNLRSFSLERLLIFINRLGYDVEIIVSPSVKYPGELKCWIHEQIQDQA